MGKTRLLYIGDYSNTGFGTVAKGLLRGLAKTDKYDILQLGINYNDTQIFDEPWKIVPAGFHSMDQRGLMATDAYGYTKAEVFVERFDPDIVFVNNDYAVAKQYLVNQKSGKPTELLKHRSIKVLYAPVDSEPVPEQYVEIAKLYDLNIAYTYWQRQLFAQHDPIFSLMPVLYHGYSHEVLKPMDKREAKEAVAGIFEKYNGETLDPEWREKFINSFLVYFVGTNQFRKDLPALFRAFALLKDDVPEAMLFPQTNNVPMGNNGWVLTNLQKLTQVYDAILVKHANVYNEQEMNVLYNAADVLAYPTRGEGFGLPSLEAMAVKTPVAATRFGPQAELHEGGRGYPVEIRDVIPGDIFAWSYFVLPDHRSLYKQLKFIHDNPEHVAETVEKAYNFASAYTWDRQAEELDKILSKIPMDRSGDGESTG